MKKKVVFYEVHDPFYLSIYDQEHMITRISGPGKSDVLVRKKKARKKK